MSARQTCSELCRHRLGLSKRQDRQYYGHPWSPEEEAKLEELANTHLSREVVARYNRWAVQRGFPKRGRQALDKKMRDEFGTSRAVLDGWNLSDLARYLDITPDRVHMWRKRGRLPYRRIGHRMVVYRSDLITLAKTWPHLLGGIHVENLFWLLEDREWAEAIARDYPQMMGQRRAVIRLRDGKRFPSVAAVTALFGISRGHLVHCIRRGWRCHGERYVYADQYAPKESAS